MDACTPTFVAAQSTTVTLIKAGNTRLDAYSLYNPGAAAAFLQFFNAKQISDVTLGTTVPVMAIEVPSTGTVSLAGIKAAFLLGMCIAATTTATGNSAPATAMVVNLGIR
jgi:hypothetical protein